MNEHISYSGLFLTIRLVKEKSQLFSSGMRMRETYCRIKTIVIAIKLAKQSNRLG